eukprot:CAMPEP_0174302030 /NCGR_PEP_ID=MMETSP0809-20121228/59397_1 /TAXON_ID=73025 ORGANISM="Eutreptiella gymnastica-like, Strain CCMP1594" /NCGR_SAMPLE_ID=MMETSP0809 /ASSEMBLY_ACC=CAM_ASM_000658 /LENGTH=120 /DNA_ID=CAMNT_0015407889 /DNA_START=1366 /DNA_END=1725 /DNA_ORIENTATION=-
MWFGLHQTLCPDRSLCAAPFWQSTGLLSWSSGISRTSPTISRMPGTAHGSWTLWSGMAQSQGAAAGLCMGAEAKGGGMRPLCSRTAAALPWDGAALALEGSSLSWEGGSTTFGMGPHHTW